MKVKVKVPTSDGMVQKGYIYYNIHQLYIY